MSFLTRTIPTLRSRAALAPRAFSTTFVAQKTPTEAVKGAAKTVDRKVSDVLVEGIELGQTATKKVKEATGIHSSSDAKGKASELVGEAKGKASELTGQAKGSASEAAGEVKGKANEVKGKF